jgi:8-oxo-dGTP diphosphatase
VTAVHVIRHAKAKNRLEWTEPDAARPLTKRGRREAAALAERFRSEPPDRLVSSPFLRCVETLDPLARELDLPIETTELLAEGVEGARALELLLSLSRTGSLACCTHADVLFELTCPCI